MTTRKLSKAAAATQKASQEEQEGLRGRLAQFRDYFEQSKAELKKVTWPTRKETVATSIAVVVLVVVMALFLGLVDMGLAKAIEKILS
jgi:preprotein translocase subunit SecE